MVNLLDEAKERDTWLLYWGDTSVTVSMPLKKEIEPGELDNYIGMVQAHGKM